MTLPSPLMTPPLAPTPQEHPRHGHRNRRHRAPAIFFLVPFAFIFLIASKTVTQANLLQFSWPQPFVLLDNLGAGLRSARLPDDHRLHQQLHPHRGQRRRSGPLQRDGRLRLAAPGQPARPGRQHPGAGRPDRAPRRRSHHLGAAEGWAVQDHARSDLRRDRLRTAVLHPAVPRLHVLGARGNWTKPPWWTGPDPCRSSSG